MPQSVAESLAVLPQYSASLLKIVKKLGGVDNLVYLPLQYRIHVSVQNLMQERGEVRIVVVKPRQVRSSTYFKSLEYHQMNEFPGTQALTVTHRSAVTDELFATLKRFHDHMPDSMKIPAKKDNDDVLYLANESKSKVATAGSDAARGFPCRILILSEYGRMTGRQTKDVQEGAMQTLATGYGSFGVIESTSGGGETPFHRIAKLGQIPEERWKTIFFGWQEEPEYRLMPPVGWKPSDEERELAKHFGLDIFQLYWRHDKLKSELDGSILAFNREYPATFDMAFEAAGGKLLDFLAVLRARKKDIPVDRFAPIIMGVDPAGRGDRTVIVIRQGNKILKHYIWRTMDDATLTGIVNRLMNEWNVHTCFMDMGYGHGTVSHLRDMGRFNVIGVWANATASRAELYRNKRTEMAAEVRDWVHQGHDDRGGLVDIPDDDEFCDDLKAIPDLEFSGAKAIFFLPPKEKIKEELGRSTDCFDALGLTFAYPVRSDQQRRLILPDAEIVPVSILQTSQAFAELQANQESIKLNPNFRYYSFGS